ncbi:MAG: hypothetical protein IJV26_02345, partial [Lachnospiraceae bacterium]|nr:hypothetical protein [Lachnospiraceae bacterium]
MRTAVSRWMLAHLEQNTPEWVRCLEIRILLNLASRSFRSKKIRVGRRSASEALQAYAVYTAACMSETEADPRRLYESAFQLGKRLRRLTGLTGQQDVQRLIFYLYRNIQITM